MSVSGTAAGSPIPTFMAPILDGPHTGVLNETDKPKATEFANHRDG
jgi:hypothetical protein